MELSAAWLSDVNRANELVQQDGIYVKDGAADRRYVGTIRASANNETEDSSTKRFIWNYYNRTTRPMFKTESTDSWAGPGANTWQYANNDSSNALEMVTGFPEESIKVFAQGKSKYGAGAFERWIGIGDVKTAVTNTTQVTGAVEAEGPAKGLRTISASLYTVPRKGYTKYKWMEAGDGTFYGDDGDSSMNSSGISALWSN
jgi:hypothetical protein